MDSNCFKYEMDAFNLDEDPQKFAPAAKLIVKRERSFSTMNPLEYKRKVCPKTPVFRPLQPPQGFLHELALPPAQELAPLSLSVIKEEDEISNEANHLPKSPKEFKKPTARPKDKGDGRKREDLSRFEIINKRIKLNGNKFNRIRSQSENISDYSIMGFLEKALIRKKSIVTNN